MTLKQQNKGVLLLTAGCVSLLFIQFGNHTLNLFTGIVLLFSVILSCWSLLIGVFTLLKTSQKTQVNISTTFVAVLICLVVLELFLRFGLNKHPTYQEKNGLTYSSTYTPYNTGRYHLYKPNQKLWYSLKEFEYHRQVNSMGLCEKELYLQKKDGEFTILGLGDSFMEGVGTSQDSTWLKSLEFHLNETKQRQVTTINAGISGSDIIYEWVLLKEKLTELNPDLVIFEINTSDVTDLVIRGGMERFVNDSLVKYRDPPSFENFYAVSYVFRHILHDILNYNFLLIPTDEMEAREMNAVRLINKTVLEIKEYTDRQGFDFFLILNPREEDIVAKAYAANDFSTIANGVVESSFDLLQYYLNHNTINEQNRSEYYWELDLHYTPKGYWQMGKIVAEQIDEKILESPILPDTSSLRTY